MTAAEDSEESSDDEDSETGQVIDSGVSEGEGESRQQAAQGEDETDGEAVEEAPIKKPRNPEDPTSDERERHWAAGHLPYRPWCPVCVKARCKEDGHYSKVKKEKTGGMTTVSMDYATIGDREDDVDARKIVVGKDRWTKSVFCHLVKCKGLGDGKIVDKIVKSVAEMGHTKIRVKTDGEPALVQVQDRVIEVRTHSATPDNPPAHDPQSNGEAERAVQDVKAQMRAIVLALEAELDSKVDSR